MEVKAPQLLSPIIYYTFDDRKEDKIVDVVNPQNEEHYLNPSDPEKVNFVDGINGVALELGNGKGYASFKTDSLVEYVGTFKPGDTYLVTFWGKFDGSGGIVFHGGNRFEVREYGSSFYIDTSNGLYSSTSDSEKFEKLGITEENLKEWNFYAFEFTGDDSGSYGKWYINGKLLDEGDFSLDGKYLLSSLYLWGYSSEDMDGAIFDELKIYKANSPSLINQVLNTSFPINYPQLIDSTQVTINTSNPPKMDNPVFGKFSTGNGSFAIWADDDGNYWIDVKSQDNDTVTVSIETNTGEKKEFTINANQRSILEGISASSFTVEVGIGGNTGTQVSFVGSLEKRGIVGYSTKTITFGDEASATFQIPVLDITEKVELTFGKYERLMPNGETVIATVPAAVESQAIPPTAEPITETINIENPGKPVKPDKADFINPETGELDKAAYNAAVAEYKEALAAYKTALKEYKAAVKAVKLEAKGQVKSLKVEEKAIKTVNKALAKLVKGEQKADKYVTKAEVSLEKAANYRTLAEELRAEANERATALLGEGWTMEDLEAKLVKPDKADFIDPETGELDKEAYDAAVAEYKEAKAIAKLFAKADKYDIKADKLEAKAELYQQKALEVTAKTVDKFKSTLESLIAKYTGKAESLKATGEGLLAQAQNLTGADYYKALGKGLYSVELAEGYARGAEIATAVLETYVDIDVSVNPDVAASLDSVDISSVNVSI